MLCDDEASATEAIELVPPLKVMGDDEIYLDHEPRGEFRTGGSSSRRRT